MNMKNISLGDLLQIIEPGEKVCIKEKTLKGHMSIKGEREEFIENDYFDKKSNVTSVWFSPMYNAIFIEVESEC